MIASNEIFIQTIWNEFRPNEALAYHNESHSRLKNARWGKTANFAGSSSGLTGSWRKKDASPRGCGHRKIWRTQNKRKTECETKRWPWGRSRPNFQGHRAWLAESPSS